MLSFHVFFPLPHTTAKQGVGEEVRRRGKTKNDILCFALGIEHWEDRTEDRAATKKDSKGVRDTAGRKDTDSRLHKNRGVGVCTWFQEGQQKICEHDQA